MGSLQLCTLVPLLCAVISLVVVCCAVVVYCFLYFCLWLFIVVLLLILFVVCYCFHVMYSYSKLCRAAFLPHLDDTYREITQLIDVSVYYCATFDSVPEVCVYAMH